MPLQPGKKNQGKNIEKLVHEGYPQKQAVAISFSKLREDKKMTHLQKRRGT